MRQFIWLGAISAGISVLTGAFGAHGLRGKISEEMLAVFETGVRYQMYHALGLILVGLFGLHKSSGLVDAAGWLMLAGTFLFSGSLYALALGGPRWLGPITPLGGLSFMVAWGVFAFAAMRA